MGLYDNVTKKYSNGVTINLFVTTETKKCIFPAGFNKWRNRINVKVCAKAKDNQANLEVVKIVAEFFNKPIENVYILSGKKTNEKTVYIRDISENKVFQKLKESLNGL